MNDQHEQRTSRLEESFNQMRDEFDQHIASHERYESENLSRFKKLIDVQHKNTAAISSLTKSVIDVSESTKSIVKLHEDFQGAARIGRGLQEFMLWLLKWGVIGGAMVTLLLWVTDRN